MKIGSWFKDCDKIQKSVRRDPFPHIPFYDAKPPYLTKGEVGVALIVVVLFVILWWVA